MPESRPFETQEPIHEWFGLTYSNYLVLPRSILQSMPLEWQQRFVRCLREVDAAMGDLEDMPESYTVRAREGGLFAHDPYADYQRGRRRVRLRQPRETTEEEYENDPDLYLVQTGGDS